MFDPQFNPQSIAKEFDFQLWLALTAILMAILVLTSIAIAASTRLGQVMTLCVTLGAFMVGMLSNHFIGRKLKAIEDIWLERASILGQTEIITRTRVVELTSGEVNPITEEIEQALVPLISMADGLVERIEYVLYWIGYAILPNFQVFWLSDGVTQGHVIPIEYVALTLLYGPLYILATLCIAVILFQRIEVG